MDIILNFTDEKIEGFDEKKELYQRVGELHLEHSHDSSDYRVVEYDSGYILMDHANSDHDLHGSLKEVEQYLNDNAENLHDYVAYNIESKKMLEIKISVVE